jgi:hypothetical protein
MGLIYDTFGRKMPILIFLLICVLAEVSFSFLTNEYEFYMATIFLMPLQIIVTNPFIPDLIEEESHGMGNMLRTNTLGLANISCQGLLLLNATNYALFNSECIYFGLSLLLLTACVLLSVGMKDVVKENRTQSSEEAVTARFVVKQAWNLLWSEPLIALGIFGSTIQLNMRVIGGSTT